MNTPRFLTVHFSNSYAVVVTYTNTGVKVPLEERIVTIELTPEQQILLQPRQCGVSKGNILHESWEVTSLSKE